MPSRENMAAGFALLTTAWPHVPMTKDRMNLFAEVCGSLTDEEWAAGVGAAVRSDREHPPSPGVLLKMARPPEPARVSGAAIFESIVRAFEGGYHLEPRQVFEQWGTDARAAFVAAGGTRAFDACGTEENARWVRKTFLEAWEQMALSRPPQLPEGGIRELPTTDEQAKETLGFLDRLRRGPVKKDHGTASDPGFGATLMNRDEEP